MPTSDARYWGNFGAFAAVHNTSICDNPSTLRATVGWFPSFLDFEQVGGPWLRAFLMVTYKWFPALFGAKVLYCPNCETIAFKTKTGSKLYDFIRKYIHAPVNETMMYFEADVEANGSELVTLKHPTLDNPE